MEQQLRNSLRRAITNSRRILEKECQDQLESDFSILKDGTALKKFPGNPVLRRRLLEVLEHHKNTGLGDAEAVALLVREGAFTILNRFAALRLAEARELIPQCISKGFESIGIKELFGLAPGLRGAFEDDGYRLLLETFMDELSIDLKLLFDRRSPTAIFWPKPNVLKKFLDILNAPEIASVWENDETIGWIYQYFNGDDAAKMREKSAAPRNRMELAVRNQFFTPRYVVQFLTENTLARTWHEMMRGKSALSNQCKYLIRRKEEIFLNEGAVPQRIEDDTITKPEEIAFRAKKDPRDLRVLDPACGSGHFLLYCFDLLWKIYLEAWHDSDSASFSMTRKTLREQYPDESALELALPSLILKHNLWGVEIDPRCAQIASFALWLRAQRAWNDQNLAAGDRPQVESVHITVAEPMPGNKDLINEVVKGIDNKATAELFMLIVLAINLGLLEISRYVSSESAFEIV